MFHFYLKLSDISLLNNHPNEFIQVGSTYIKIVEVFHKTPKKYKVISVKSNKG